MKFDIAYVLCGAAVIFGLYWDVLAWPRLGRSSAQDSYLVTREGGVNQVNAAISDQAASTDEADATEAARPVGQAETPAGEVHLVADAGETGGVRAEGDVPAGEVADLWQTSIAGTNELELPEDHSAL